MDYYELDVPQACCDALDEYKSFVDPVRAFLEDILPRVKWDLLPNAFLYDLYVEWYKVNSGSERNLKGSAMFLKEVKTLIEANYPAWAVSNKTPAFNSKGFDIPFILHKISAY